MGRMKEILMELNEDYFDENNSYNSKKEELIPKNDEMNTLTKYHQVSERIIELREKRTYFANKLKTADNEDEIIEYKYQMMKLNEKLSPLVSRQKILDYRLKAEQQKKERIMRKENEIKEFEEACKKEEDKIYKKLYVTLNDDQLILLKKIFNINHNSRELIFNEMFENNSKAVVIIITSLFEILSFSEVEHISNNIEKYNEEYWSIIAEFENNELIFNKLCSLPDIKMMEEKADVKVDIFEEAYPVFKFIYEEDKENHDELIDDVYDMFIKYNYFF